MKKHSNSGMRSEQTSKRTKSRGPAQRETKEVMAELVGKLAGKLDAQAVSASPGTEVRRNGLVAGELSFPQDYLGFPVLLPFFDAQSGRSFHPLDRHPGSVARSWRRPFHRRGVASPQTPTPDRESLPATIEQSTRVGPHPRRLDDALGASNSSAPFRNCTEALDTARLSQSHEPAKVPHAVLTESPSEARPARTERRTHLCGRGNEAT